MKYAASVLALVLTAITAFSQPANIYQDDLNKVYITLQETPSYKAQIKGKALTDYRKRYDSLSQLDSDNFSSLDYFSALSQLFFPLRDNHLGFYEVFDNSNLADTVSYRKFRSSLELAAFPAVNLNLDSLSQALSGKPADSVEGIYYYGNAYSFGLYKTSGKEYVGVILESQASFWKKGQVVAKLYEYAPYSFRAIYANPLTKKFNFYPNEKFRNKSLINSYFYPSISQSNYQKKPDVVDFVNLNRTTPAFQLKEIRSDIQYLRLGNFSAFPKMMVISDKFYESIKDSLTAQNLIVDLRDNTGGAERVSKKFLTSIKQHARNARIYVLVNNGTLSQGEIFLLQLTGIKNVTTYGQTTQGKIAYGSNYGKRVRLPGGKHEIYITDMKDKKGLVKYENVGVTPQVIFDNSSDWIEQVIHIIDRSK